MRSGRRSSRLVFKNTNAAGFRRRLCLFKLYCNGLGVPVGIAKGAEYLQKVGDDPGAKQELRHYKKTLFGKWVRRSFDRTGEI